jgi:plasmid stabilization system protein ParE
MILQFSPEFRRDLRREKIYLAEHESKEYADKIGITILNECVALKSFPRKGKLASERFEIETDLRFLVVNEFMIFYSVNEDSINIVRLFNTKMDILFRMFGIDTSDPDSDDYWNE